MDKKLTDFFMQSKPLLFRRRERIIHPQDYNLFVFYLKQGFVRFYLVSEEGFELTLHIFTPTSFFPVVGISEESDYYFESLTPAEVYRVQRDRFNYFINDHPTEGLEVLKKSIFLYEQVLKKFSYKSFGSAYQQVILAILDLGLIFDSGDSKTKMINYWFTHQDLASLTGLSRERVSLEVQKLIKKGLISYQGHFIVVKNTKELERELRSK